MVATFIAAEGGVFAVDVAVAGAEFAEDVALLDAATADVVGEAGKQKAVTTIGAIVGAEVRKVFTKYAVGLGMGIVAFLELLALPDDVAIGYRRPIFDRMEGLIVADQHAGSFEWVERHKV